jgi:hypothetical protein
MTIPATTSSFPTTVRKAWLVLGSNTVQLDNPDGGWFCSSLDLGAPTVRSVLQNRPGTDGAIDRTTYMGPRTVTATITVLGPVARIDDIADNFAPYMVPSARPVLHFVLDRGTNPERTMTLRPASYDWPVTGALQRDVALQWIAADPLAYDVNQTSSPAQTVGTQSPGTQISRGDVPMKPLCRVTGPMQGGGAPGAIFTDAIAPGSVSVGRVRFVASYNIAAGHHVDLDCAAHTAFYDGDPTQSVLNQIDYAQTWPNWIVVPYNTTFSVVSRGVDATNTGTWQYFWNDAYLT